MASLRFRTALALSGTTVFLRVTPIETRTRDSTRSGRFAPPFSTGRSHRSICSRSPSATTRVGCRCAAEPREARGLTAGGRVPPDQRCT
jgi:hypothetical protein